MLADKQIKAVLFDLGETLLNFGRIKSFKVSKEASRQSYAFLKSLNQPVGKFTCYAWRNVIGIRLRYLISRITGKDFDSLETLKKYGKKRGFKLNDQQWEELNWLWYEAVRRNAWVEPDLPQTLSKLKDAGLELAVLSNTFVHASSLDRHLAQEGLFDFFKFRSYSYEFDFRKPDKRIFLDAARRIGVEPANIIYVGDRINTDIKGALAAGMKAVLKIAYTNKGKQPPPGIAKIDKISQLPELIGD